MSQKIRIGNDINITWSLKDASGQPYIVEGKDVEIELNVGTKRVKIKEFELSGNQIHFVYYGKDQKHTGSYALKYIENSDDPNMVTFDTKDAFYMVEHSWLAVDEGETPETIQLEVVTVVSELLERVGPRGYSAYDIAVQEGFVGTEEEWLESLKGEDAEVTKENIENALGYTPADANDVPTAEQKAAWDAKYNKPGTGIPKSDLAEGVQASLGKADTAVQPQRVQDIEDKIPEQASSSNQLADKAFVNSSVATNTATFRGAYNLVSDLGLSVGASHSAIETELGTKIAVADNNDYSFVQIPTADATPTMIASVERYKYNGSAWAFEYALNNSGFTADQWAAINSHITSGLVDKLTLLPTNSELNTLLSGKVDKVAGKGLSTNDYSDADKNKLGALPTNFELETALGSKADQTAVDGINTKIPEGASSENKMATQADIAGFITRSVNDLANYYLKSETYTRDEVAALIGAIQQFHYEVYTVLPATGENNVLYLIGPTGTGSDRYEEYVYANGAFTKIGDTSIDLSGYVTTTALNNALVNYTTTADLTTLLAAKAARDTNATDGNLAQFDASGNPVDSGVSSEDIPFLNQALGKYSNTSEITLSQAKAGKYVNVSGAEVSESGYGISSPISLNKGDILLVPSASAVPAAVSVVARVVTRTYDKVINYTYTYQQANPELYDTATADYDSSLVYTAVYDTSGETPVLTGWTKGGQTYETLPATHEVTESYYEALVQQAVSAMPSTGHYVYLCPQAMTVVISGYTATVNGGVCKVVGLGIFKNIATNFVGVPGQSVLAQALCDLMARVDGICERLENLGDTKAKCIDFEDIPKVCDGPMVIEGTGSPSVLPRFVGQRYHDTTANAKHLYEAFAVTGNLSDWVLIK